MTPKKTERTLCLRMEHLEGMNAAQPGRYALAGVLATLTMDVGAALLRKTGLTAGIPPAARALARFARPRQVFSRKYRSLAGVARRAPAFSRGRRRARLGFGLLTNLLPLALDVPDDGLWLVWERGARRIHARGHGLTARAVLRSLDDTRQPIPPRTVGTHLQLALPPRRLWWAVRRRRHVGREWGLGWRRWRSERLERGRGQWRNCRQRGFERWTLSRRAAH
jgi:hypothetical protein